MVPTSVCGRTYAVDTRLIYLDGEIVPLAEARISPMDIGLLRGYAVFDLLRTVGGRPFLLTEHLKRLRASAQHLGLKVPLDDEQITDVIDDLLSRNEHGEATVRLVLTGGVSPDGLTFDPETPTFCILTHDLVEPPATMYEIGTALMTREHKREVPGAKTTNYITMIHNRPEAAEIGAIDLLYHDGERIYEAASASFYVVRDGKIHAPADDVLWGTVGSFVLDLVRDRYEVVLGDVTLEEALGADEAFLTSTTRGVVPIVRLDDRKIGDGLPGPVTTEIMRTWRAALEGERP